VAKDFKRVDVEGRAPDAVETALAPIEDQAVRAIRRVIEGEAFPSDEDYNLILNLLSLILAQNPKSRRALDGARSREADAKLEWLVSSQPIWERHVALARRAGEELRGDLSHESARRFVDERRYRIAFDNLGTLQSEFEAQDELLSALAKRAWSVLLAPDRGPHFISSDYPYSLAMEHGFRGTPRFLGRNTELFFPLGKTAGFIGVLGTPLKPVVRVDSTAVSIMNRRVVRRADRQLFMPDSSFVTFDSGKLVEVHLTLSS